MNLKCFSASAALALCLGASTACIAQDSTSAGIAVQQPATAPRPLMSQMDEARSCYQGPFRQVGVGVHVGLMGAGFDVATPIARRLNVRGTADFFRYNLNLTEDGTNYGGDLKLSSGQISLDWFVAGGFHISPGVMIQKHSFDASLNVPGGNKFSLGDQDYYSKPSDPAHGAGSLAFGNSVAPMLKIGFGNIIPRSPRHWAIPVEFGAAYTKAPTLSLAMAGTACQDTTYTNCANLATDPTAQSNIKQEQSELNEDLKKIPVLPIFSIGFSYKF